MFSIANIANDRKTRTPVPKRRTAPAGQPAVTSTPRAPSTDRVGQPCPPRWRVTAIGAGDSFRGFRDATETQPTPELTLVGFESTPNGGPKESIVVVTTPI